MRYCRVVCFTLTIMALFSPQICAQSEASKNLCFDSHRIRQWLPVNDETLFVDTGKRKYRIQFQSSCANLSISPSLAFKGDPISGRVCNSSLNAVIARGELCRIRDISEIDKETFKAANSRKRASISIKKG
jgi:Family of unknown function (DUF6491)